MSEKEIKTEAAVLAENLLKDQESIKDKIKPIEPATLALLRAEIAYITDPHLRPIEYFYPIVSEYMSATTFTSHAFRRRWSVNREKVVQNAQQQMLSKMVDLLLVEQRRELVQLQQLREDLLDLCLPIQDEEKLDDGTVVMRRIWKVEPKSLEGVITAFHKLCQYMDDKREHVARVLTANAPSVDRKTEQDEGPLEHDDAVEAVKKVLELKIERQRKELAEAE